MSIICGRTGMDKIFEVKSTTGQIMNVYEDIETYTDFFNYVAWLSLQYGYSGSVLHSDKKSI